MKESGEDSMMRVSLIISVLAVLVAMVTVMGHRQHAKAVLGADADPVDVSSDEVDELTSERSLYRGTDRNLPVEITPCASVLLSMGKKRKHSPGRREKCARRG